MKPLVAICIGHSRLVNGKTQGGAVSIGGVSEHTYNKSFAESLKTNLASMGIDSFIVDRYEGSGYAAAMKWLGSHIKTKGATLAVELHFNSASPSVSGHEWIHWPSSVNGKRLAESVENRFTNSFPNMKRRGLLARTDKDSGGGFLRYTHCPAIIAEPFFGSNSADWALATEGRIKMAGAIAFGIKSYLA